MLDPVSPALVTLARNSWAGLGQGQDQGQGQAAQGPEGRGGRFSIMSCVRGESCEEHAAPGGPRTPPTPRGKRWTRTSHP